MAAVTAVVAGAAAVASGAIGAAAAGKASRKAGSAAARAEKRVKDVERGRAAIINPYSHVSDTSHLAENVSDIYYVQDFDIDDVTYRGSNMGYYSNQYSENGTTFVTAEIPYSMEEIEIDIESIKLELIKQNILVKDCKIIDYKIIDKKN